MEAEAGLRVASASSAKAALRRRRRQPPCERTSARLIYPSVVQPLPRASQRPCSAAGVQPDATSPPSPSRLARTSTLGASDLAPPGPALCPVPPSTHLGGVHAHVDGGACSRGVLQRQQGLKKEEGARKRRPWRCAGGPRVGGGQRCRAAWPAACCTAASRCPQPPTSAAGAGTCCGLVLRPGHCPACRTSSVPAAELPAGKAGAPHAGSRSRCPGCAVSTS